MRRAKKPLILDGDGITAACKDRGAVSDREDTTVLTPHLGEMARISGNKVAKIDDNKVTVVQQEAADLGAVVVLKGAHSLIGYPDGRVHINLSGNSGMATAGSGDVLTGTIAAMYGLGLSIEDAARTGVFIHGLSGDIAAEKIGEDGITAQDILETLPKAVKLYREDYDRIIEGCYGRIHSV